VIKTNICWFFCHFGDIVEFSRIFSFSDTHLWVIFVMKNRQTHWKILQKWSQVVVDDVTYPSNLIWIRNGRDFFAINFFERFWSKAPNLNTCMTVHFQLISLSVLLKSYWLTPVQCTFELISMYKNTWIFPSHVLLLKTIQQ